MMGKILEVSICLYPKNFRLLSVLSKIKLFSAMYELSPLVLTM